MAYEKNVVVYQNMATNRQLIKYVINIERYAVSLTECTRKMGVCNHLE